MTWWWETVRAACDRWDGWLTERDEKRATNRYFVAAAKAADAKYEPEWFIAQRGVEDTGSIVATPEDLAEIGIVDPVTRTGRRHQGRHARPKDFEETL